jgi:hypothetical protein
MVELMRDREGQPRLSVRSGCARLAKRLPGDIITERAWNAETIRRHYKTFEMRQSNDHSLQHFAARLLKIARARRQELGRDANILLLITEPHPAEYALADAIVSATERQPPVHSELN